MTDPKPWKGNRQKIGVVGSLPRSILALYEGAGFVLVDVRDAGHPSRIVLRFSDTAYDSEVTIEDFETGKSGHGTDYQAEAANRSRLNPVEFEPGDLVLVQSSPLGIGPSGPWLGTIQTLMSGHGKVTCDKHLRHTTWGIAALVDLLGSEMPPSWESEAAPTFFLTDSTSVKLLRRRGAPV